MQRNGGERNAAEWMGAEWSGTGRSGKQRTITEEPKLLLYYYLSLLFVLLHYA